LKLVTKKSIHPNKTPFFLGGGRAALHSNEIKNPTFDSLKKGYNIFERKSQFCERRTYIMTRQSDVCVSFFKKKKKKKRVWVHS